MTCKKFYKHRIIKKNKIKLKYNNYNSHNSSSSSCNKYKKKKQS